MKRLFVIALLAVGLVPNLSRGVEIKNIRACYGPLGAYRADLGELRVLPGDIVYLNYDIDDLQIDTKTGKASFDTILELLDSNKKVIFEKKTPNDPTPHLGGARIPGEVHVIMGAKQAPGKYVLRLTVNDKNAKGENRAKAFVYPFEVGPETFGFIETRAYGVGFPGTPYGIFFALVNMGLDAKKLPNVEVNIKILDEKGKPVATPVQMLLPRDLPENADLEKANYAPFTYPVFLNRPGRFTFEVTANDKLAKKTAKMSFQLTVVDVSSIVSK